MEKGKVYIVGSGPGEVDLMTIRAQRIIQQASLVLYADSLVQQEVANLASPEAEVIPSASLTLEQLVEKMVAAVREGKTVARVHSGDPSLYGALYEQLALLNEAGIEYEIVPGVSAVFAAAARLGVELTVPEVAQSLILTRLSGRASPVPEKENLKSLAGHGTTLAIYLSITRCREVVAELLAGGYSPETPAAAIYQVNWPDEKIIVCELKELADLVVRAGLSRQSLILVGQVLAPALQRERGTGLRSRLYHPAHSHIFRKGEPATGQPGETASPQGKTTETPAVTSPSLAIVSLTRNGATLAGKIGSELRANGDQAEVFAPLKFAGAEMTAYRGKPLELIRELFANRSRLVLVMPLAIAVRAVGGLARDKKQDPAVVVADEAGKFIISMLGGHLGGANQLASRVAPITGGQAVITTASDVQGLPALDLLGREEGWKIANPENLTAASAALVNGELLGVWQEAGDTGVTGPLLALEGARVVPAEAPEQLTGEEIKAALVITFRRPGIFQARLREKAVFYHPPSLVLGIGCRRGVSSQKLEQTVQSVLDEYGLAREALACFGSATLKEDEAGLLDLASRWGVPLRFFTPEELNALNSETPLTASAARRLLGVQGVAEPAALLASGASRLLVAKVKDEDVTVAVAVLNPGPPVGAARGLAVRL